jgi:hypothetical protein
MADQLAPGTHNAVRAIHTRITRDRTARADGVVLVLHGTTEPDFSGRATPGLGPIGNGGGRGREYHDSLAVSTSSGRSSGRPTRSSTGGWPRG